MDNEAKLMQTREYMPGDEQDIAELFNVVFGRQLDLGSWNWQYLENPFGTGIIHPMFDKKILVGHYAVTPVDLLVKAIVHKAAKGHGSRP